MSDTETREHDGGWEPWMDNPFMIDQLQGTVLEETTRYQMQTRDQDGAWQAFNTPRENRDEVTLVQAFHLNKDPEDHGLRVLTKRVIWTVDEVPGRGEGQTPPEEILARNEEATKRLLKTGDNTQKPTE